MNNHFALILSVCCLFQTTLAAVQNAKLMELPAPDSRKHPIQDLEEDEEPWMKVEVPTMQNMTMTAFARSAAQVLEPLPFITRDSIASLILMTDGVFGNMTGIVAVVSQVLNMANLILSSFPFGALLPILVQVVLNVLMAPQTRYFAKYLLYRIWLLFPASTSDRYTVQVTDGNVIVSSISNTLPGPFQPSIPPFQPTVPSISPPLPQR